MDQKKIERINELSRRLKAGEQLTEAEHLERKTLHREYVDSVLGQLKGHLDNTYVVDRKGNKQKLKKKDEV